jgi:type IV secretion system protein TrbG
VFIEFPCGIGQGELPPLFVIGPEGEGRLVNYRVRQNYMIVDRLFAAAELRLGQRQQTVRIVRTDGVRRGLFGGHQDGAVLVDPAGRSDGGGS